MRRQGRARGGMMRLLVLQAASTHRSGYVTMQRMCTICGCHRPVNQVSCPNEKDHRVITLERRVAALETLLRQMKEGPS